MGYYINPPDGRRHEKGQWLIEECGAAKISQEEALNILGFEDNDKGVVCVVDNGPFEAAAFCYDLGEFEAFTYITDCRKKQWYSLNRRVAEHLSSYSPRT
jgi:hypothetical protein